MAAVRAIGLAKQYQIQGPQAYRTLRESLARSWRLPFRRRAGQGENEALWALDDVSFEIGNGEIVGIIGRNGAGKSTLLKILSRITTPTRGEAQLRGRVGALLEVGTGFHPELTGRENVFLSGAILGMKKAEMVRKFDAIVAFAGVERFLETQVKHYSSGMFTRLAFSVAAHLEPEILIVDEVLAVGDASFQRKCLGKMSEIGKEGRTVLFVSHNMTAVTRLCPRTILLDAGKILKDGPSHEVVGTYLHSDLGTTAAREWHDAAAAPGNHVVRLSGVRARTEDHQVSAAFDIRRPIAIEVDFVVLQEGHVLVPNLHFFNEEGTYMFAASEGGVGSPWHRRPRPIGAYRSTAWVPGNFLAEGTVVVGVAVSTMDPVTIHFYERDAVAFQVIDSLEGDSARGDYAGPFPGVVRPLLRWESAERAPMTAGQIAESRS
jgi:homopolymeric O-antigen transport system ATP-binding protein